jgi:DNA polymerase phi
MSSLIWPQISKHLNVTKDNITIDPLYLLLLIEENHPETIDLKFMKKNWQSEKVMCSENFETFAQLLWKDDKTTLINHPFYVYFMKQIVDFKLTREFWSMQVDNLLSRGVSKNVEMITINAALSILKHTIDKPKELFKLLTPNFLKMINDRGVKMERDEDFTELYKDFYELLDQQLQALKKSETKLQAFHTFTKICVEKSSAKKFITNLLNSLELDELKQAVNYMKKIIVSESEEQKERQYVATVLHRIIASNKLVANDIEWRVEQQIFIANLAFLNSLNGCTIVKDGEANSIALVMKNLFYHSLESKMSKLEDEKKILFGIVQHLNSFVAKNDLGFLQKTLDKKYIDCWTKMYSEVTSNCAKKEKKLKLVFHILMLHMALQLFNNPELADNAIAELEQVMDRAMMKKKKQNENEPEWIEVVIDLFLTLLSQESSVLRNVIRHVFPQLCSQISVTAFNQILSMLDIRSKENPLTIGDGDDQLEESEFDDESDDEMEIDESDGEAQKGNGTLDSSALADSDDDDDDDEGNALYLFSK